MARYTKTDVVTGDVVKSDVNVQLGLIETAIADSLSRKGDLPNTMEADIDMNSNQILNLPDATTSQEPATYGQLLSVPAVQQGKSYVQEDVPVNPTTEGVRWYKPSEARTYVWYIDSDGGQWVEENPSVADAPDRVRPYDTVALWQASPNAAVDDVVQLKDRANGIFDVISGTGTANTYNIIAHNTLSLSLELREAGEFEDKAFGAKGDGSTNDLSAIQAVIDAGDVGSSGDWWDKRRVINLNHGNRVGIGSYQSSYSGIHMFATLDWPENSTVKFNAGSGERVEHQSNIADNGTPVNEWRFESPYHPAILLNQRQPSSYGSFTQEAHGPAGSHTGANNASVLTDSTLSLTVNELAGDIIENTTDGSSASIISNTATTITATLSGGTDNDWDTGDEFITYPSSQRFTSILFQTDTIGQFQFFDDTRFGTLQIKSWTPSDGGNTLRSRVWAVDAETGDQSIQASSIDTTDNSSLMVGGSMKIRSGTAAINGHETETEPRLYFHEGVAGTRTHIGIDTLTDAINIKSLTNTSEGDIVLKLEEDTTFQKCSVSGLPPADAAMRIGHNTTTNKSIVASGDITVNGENAIITAGSGTPEGVVTAIRGSLFMRTDGGAGTCLYVKESGTGNTGWVAK